MIISDTNELSELVRPQPSPRVIASVRGQPKPMLFPTSITRGERLYGVETLPASSRRIAPLDTNVQILENVASVACRSTRTRFGARRVPTDVSSRRAMVPLGQPGSRAERAGEASYENRSAPMSPRNST